MRIMSKAGKVNTLEYDGQMRTRPAILRFPTGKAARQAQHDPRGPWKIASMAVVLLLCLGSWFLVNRKAADPPQIAAPGMAKAPSGRSKTLFGPWSKQRSIPTTPREQTPEVIPAVSVDARRFVARLPTKLGGCTSIGGLPDAACTPGAVTELAMADVCTTRTASRRRVSQIMRKRVYAAYGLRFPQPRGSFQIDHLIPLELGGSNEFANLWPEPVNALAHQKDLVENALHQRV
jgi:hypothetical protein